MPERGANETGHSPQPTVELSPSLRQHLLSPAVWRESLEKYAHATNLAVALSDAGGGLLGECINPRPTWSLLRARKPAVAEACPFCLLPLKPGTCLAEASAKDGFRLARDRTGLVHFTVPLVLGEHRLGTLVAGQVFDRYPDSLMLEIIANQLGLPPQEVWQTSRLEPPVKEATLRVYAELLATLADHLLLSCYHSQREAERLAEMMRLSEELRERSDTLAEADRRKDEFLAMLAHELRNPLAPICHAMAVLRKLGPKDPKLQWGHDVIERQTTSLTRLIDDLLDVSRITRGKITLDKKPIELATVIKRAIEVSRPLIEARHHALEITLPSEPLRLKADFTRLSQVVANLLNNAAKYTAEGGQITLRVMTEGEEAIISVKDTGVGIPSELLPHVFELFIQGSRSLDRSQGGLGIGLTLVQRLVEMHGGRIAARSAGLGQGAEFIVRLPLLKMPAGEESTAPEVVEPISSSHAKLRVLVVDDSLDAAESLALLLQLEGHEVEIVTDGLEALKVAESFQPQIIVLDIGLPGLDGYQVAERLRVQQTTCNALLIALTGYGQERDRRRAEAAGFDEHLVKPIDPALLPHLIRQYQATGRVTKD